MPNYSHPFLEHTVSVTLSKIFFTFFNPMTQPTFSAAHIFLNVVFIPQHFESCSASSEEGQFSHEQSWSTEYSLYECIVNFTIIVINSKYLFIAWTIAFLMPRCFITYRIKPINDYKVNQWLLSCNSSKSVMTLMIMYLIRTSQLCLIHTSAAYLPVWVSIHWLIFLIWK